MKLSKENFDNILAMLNSQDVENRVVGFTCIENSDFDKNFVMIMFLYKLANSHQSEWLEHAPKICKKIKKLSSTDFVTYNGIFKEVVKRKKKNKISIDDIDFFIKRFNEFLIGTLNKSNNYPQIESIEVKFKDMNYGG